MSCSNCNSTTVNTVSLSYSTSANCVEDSGCSVNLSSQCVFFNAPNLACSGIVTGDSVEIAIQKIDERLCAVSGDYSTYNFHCLDDVTPITSESQFVSAITSYICALSSSLTTFTGTTFVSYQASVDSRFDAIEGPSLTCSSAGILSTDTLVQALNKYCTKFAAIDSSLDISSVTWDSCFTVTPPTSIAEGFSVLADQICQTKALINGSSLPTFNNTGACLSTSGSADSLVATINAIKTRLCQTPTLDNDNLTSSCISIPAGDTDLEGILQNIINKIDFLSTNLPSFDSGDFTVTGTGCSGKNVALATPINQDRFVAANTSDSSPSTLINKIVGVGCTVDDSTTAGKITITVAASSVSDGKVKADSADAATDYLINKVEAGASVSGVGINISYNATTDKVKVASTVDTESLLSSLLTYLEENPDSEIASRLCAVIASCPSPCEGPTNIQAVAVAGTTTSTTTTTTTT